MKRSVRKTTAVTIPPSAKRQLAKLGVASVYFFGSRASGVAGPLSDFDFGVLLTNQRRVQKGSFPLYQRLYKIFSSFTHPEILEADVIDIIFLDSPRVPLELKFHIIRHGTILFDADPPLRANFESLIMLKTADFVPHRVAMRAALLARL